MVPEVAPVPWSQPVFLSSGAQLARRFIGSVFSTGSLGDERRGDALADVRSGPSLPVGSLTRSSQRLHATALRMFRRSAVSLLDARRKECVDRKIKYSVTTLDQRGRDSYTFQAHRLVPPHIRRGTRGPSVAGAPRGSK